MLGIAWRNFLLQFSRYRVMAAALILGALVFTVLFGVTSSLNRTVREKAARYFSGDVMVLRMDGKRSRPVEDEATILKAMGALDLPQTTLYRRSLYPSTDARLNYNGTSLVQRRVIGVDFSAEGPAFSNLDFTEGGLGDGDTRHSIWVSSSTADRLHLGLGDTATLLLKSSSGAATTADLQVGGIFRDTSLFGFALYMDYRTLNSLLERPEDSLTEVGMEFAGEVVDRSIAKEVHQRLSKSLRLTPQGLSIEGASEWLEKHPAEGPTYAVFSLGGRLKQVADLIGAVSAVNTLLTAVFLLIVAIGVYNTYQMIAFERTREVGTLRALGMSRGAVLSMFLLESMILALFSAAVGLVLGALVYGGLCQVDFSGNLLAQMFLRKGHLVWNWPWENVLAVGAVMWFTALAGALVPAYNVAHCPPVDALRHEG